MADLTKFIDEIKKLTVQEINSLVKALEEEFGVSAAAQVAVGAGPALAPVEEVEEKTEFDVVINSVGDKKIAVIKVVREATGLGLVQAKALVDGAPAKVKEAIGKEEADELVAKLKEAGADAEAK